ncbi:MAG: C_GCAxxG_C_C family protein [Firmicutes bacterium]|nr:C_GCAxxG_C_C family protein [Bacillota bacterium]
MSDMAQTAEEIYLSGASCAEAIWLTYAHKTGMCSQEAVFGNRLAVGFSSGAGVEDLCGALAGAILALGHKFGREPGEQRNPKLKTYCQQLCQQAEQQLGSLHCRDLRISQERGKCGSVVRKVAQIFDEVIAADL